VLSGKGCVICRFASHFRSCSIRLVKPQSSAFFKVRSNSLCGLWIKYIKETARLSYVGTAAQNTHHNLFFLIVPFYSKDVKKHLVAAITIKLLESHLLLIPKLALLCTIAYNNREAA